MASENVGRVLVTGATGFIASHVVHLLLKEGHKVRGTVKSLKEDDARIKELLKEVRAMADNLELVEANLYDEESLKLALVDCSHVIHLASPVSFASPSNENSVINPAVNGTTAILKQSAEVSSVRRVIYTSDALAISGAYRGGKFTEKNWGKVENPYVITYVKSKILAEKAAWDFMEKLQEEYPGRQMELVVLNPVAVMGPSLIKNQSVMQRYLAKIVTGRSRYVPRINLPVIDVRDVAKAHVRSLSCHEIAGLRIILTGGSIDMSSIIKVLETEFGPQGYIIKTKIAPDWISKLKSSMKADRKLFSCGIGKKNIFDDERMREMLAIEPIDMPTMVKDTVYSLIQNDFAPKASGYKGKSE